MTTTHAVYEGTNGIAKVMYNNSQGWHIYYIPNHGHTSCEEGFNSLESAENELLKYRWKKIR